MNEYKHILRYGRTFLSVEQLYQRIHLQWFAAEDEGRTEQPTERKLRKSREEGKVIRTADLPSAATLLFVAVALGFLGKNIFNVFIEMTSFYFRNVVEMDIRTANTIWIAFYVYFLRIFIPISMAALVAAILGNVLQVGFYFTGKPLQLDWKKIAPNFKQLFKKTLFSSEGQYYFLKLIIKIIVIVLVFYFNIYNRIPVFVGFMTMPLHYSLVSIGKIVFFILVEVAVAFLFLSIIDYAVERRRHMEQLKMTRQELKEERKSEEGDPHVRSRLRQRMQELLSRTMMQKVKEADVVVANPVHYAVAVQYDARKMEAPTVMAKGADHMAIRIKNLAKEHNVPIIENKPLARGLYHDTEVGDIIPEKYYEAMVVVLSEVYRMRGM